MFNIMFKITAKQNTTSPSINLFCIKYYNIPILLVLVLIILAFPMFLLYDLLSEACKLHYKLEEYNYINGRMMMIGAA